MSSFTPISENGMYSHVTREQYHGACTVKPSISASHAIELVDECPALFWANYYLNPNRIPKKPKKAFAIGEATHLLLLEPEKFHEAVVLSKFDEFRTNEAKEWRDRTLATGKIILKNDELLELKAMRDSVMKHPIAAKLFEMEGLIEQTLIFTDKETGAVCKSRPDWMPTSFKYVVDIKTAADPNPREFEKSIANHNYYMKMAWQADAIEAVHGVRPEGFAFIVVGSSAPFLSVVAWLEMDAIDWGVTKCRKARDLFAQGIATGEWPSYEAAAGGAFHVSLPGWATSQLKMRETFGEFQTRADLAAVAEPEAKRVIQPHEFGI